MTTLLVRSVLYPDKFRPCGNSIQRSIRPVFARSEGTILDIWEGNQITEAANSPR